MAVPQSNMYVSQESAEHMQKKTSDIRLGSNSTGMNLIDKNGPAIPIPELIPRTQWSTGRDIKGMNCRLIRQDPKVELREINMHEQTRNHLPSENSNSDNEC